MIESLAVKGVGGALLITIPEGPWKQIRQEVLLAIDEKADFFRGAQLAVEIHDRALSAADLGDLRDRLASREITLATVLARAAETRSAAADLGMALELPKARDQDVDDQPLDTELVGAQAVLLHRTIRSGHSIRTPGHVVVIGDVNPGAEIIAGGNVVIWGRMRGVVHAGAAGDETAVVCALDLAPTQLRIAGHITVSPERKGKSRPEMAKVKDDQLIAEDWAIDRKV
jgi:septum site-determining protein MinC